MKNIINNIKGMRGRDLLSITDLNKQEILSIVNLAEYIKTLSKIGVKSFNYLVDKKVALIFQKHSTRTRASFSVALQELGTQSYYFSWNELQLARGESIRDTASVLNRYFDAAILRVYKHSDLEEFANYFDGPVINALSDLEHPCQILSDFFTIYEKFGKLEGIKISYIGDGNNNVAISLLLGSAILGTNITIISPKRYQPTSQILEKAQIIAKKSGSSIRVTEEIKNSMLDPNIIYTDTFVSMGMESEKEIRLKELKDYQVNEKIFELNPNAYFMHCAPWHLGEEVTEGVVYGKNSIVFEQAENRLHTSKAILIALLK